MRGQSGGPASQRDRSAREQGLSQSLGPSSAHPASAEDRAANHTSNEDSRSWTPTNLRVLRHLSLLCAGALLQDECICQRPSKEPFLLEACRRTQKTDRPAGLEVRI